jgi:RHS repeat-associated protein
MVEKAMLIGPSYYRARYYNPTLQRFISEDSPAFDPGDMSLYGYVGNDPINKIDPSGWQIICPITNPACGNYPTQHLSDCAKKILQPYFPGLNLSTVDLVPELPGLTNLAPIDVGAITWDNTIYYQPSMFSGSAAGIAAIGHELTHVQQQSGGLGSFLGNYIGDYVKNLVHGDSLADAYSNIQAEKSANNMEGRIGGDLLKMYGRKDPCEKYCQ